MLSQQILVGIILVGRLGVTLSRYPPQVLREQQTKGSSKRGWNDSEGCASKRHDAVEVSRGEMPVVSIVYNLTTPPTATPFSMLRHCSSMSCDILTNTPARTSPTNFQLHYLIIQISYTNCLGHGHGCECHSPHHPALSGYSLQGGAVGGGCGAVDGGSII